MKAISFILFFLISYNATSQVKLCEENARMYSICYSLDSNGMFTYYFNSCTGSSIGKGKYIKKRNSLTFEFDTLISPQINSQHDSQLIGKVKITCIHATKVYPLTKVELEYDGIINETDTNGTVVLEYNGGPIVYVLFCQYKDSTILHPDTEGFNSYTIYSHTCFNTFVQKGEVIKMKRKGKRYKYKHKVRHYSERRG